MHRSQLHGTRMLEAEAGIPSRRRQENIEQARAYGLESAWSITDRTIPLFSRNLALTGKYSAAGTFLGVPFQDDMRALESPDVVFVGAPLDAGTTYRSGTRFGPEAIRSISALYSGYNFEMGIDLIESLDMVDAGDITVIPANIEKSFDQIDKGVAYLHEHAVFPVVLGGDHSIGYPDIRGLAPYVDGNIGIIHFDRHTDMSELNLDERMHGTPFFHATNIPNAPPVNLVQIGIGGWNGSRYGVKNARERGATSITLTDIDRLGLDRVAEMALEIAWKNATCVFLSFDIDSIDPAFAPGTGTPEPGGLLPREAFRLLQTVTREGLCGMEVVEVAPPYDVAETTSLLAARVICDVLGTLVAEGKLGRRSPEPEEEPADRSEENPA
ncbi:MAG: agmatinase [Thermomicrobiales bacterium]|nr:agmatinase [Thermomicrobiales bacterium]